MLAAARSTFYAGCPAAPLAEIIPSTLSQPLRGALAAAPHPSLPPRAFTACRIAECRGSKPCWCADRSSASAFLTISIPMPAVQLA